MEGIAAAYLHAPVAALRHGRTGRRCGNGGPIVEIGAWHRHYAVLIDQVACGT